jgi:hypothetical protein
MRYIFTLIASVLSLQSCDMPECKNTNPVFEQYAVDSREYKAELVKQLHATPQDKLEYWVDQYIEKNGKPYMSVFIQAPGLCAKGILDITNDKDLGNFKSVKGGGYRGAELKGLKYHIDSSADNYEFVYESVEAIID